MHSNKLEDQFDFIVELKEVINETDTKDNRTADEEKNYFEVFQLI